MLISTADTLYLDRPTDCNRVLLKIVRVLLQHKDHTLDTYAVLDVGSESTILVAAVASKLGL